ncbi:MAG: hypothetical protein WCJ81_06295 [bacterium]
MIFLSGCNAIADISRSIGVGRFAIKLVSIAQLLCSLNKSVPDEFHKVPTSIFPSGCSAMLLTSIAYCCNGEENDGSIAPVVVNLTIALVAFDRAQPTRIYQLGWTTMVSISELREEKVLPASNQESKVPFAFSLKIRWAAVQLYQSKLPPTSIFPSGCRARALTAVAYAPNSFLTPNHVSIDPSGFNLAIFVFELHHRCDCPPIIIFPSGCCTIVRTSVSHCNGSPLVHQATTLNDLSIIGIQFPEFVG